MYENYFDTRVRQDDWGGKNFTIKYYHKSFSSIFSYIKKSGLKLSGIYEPKPTSGLKEVNPEKYQKCIQQPLFLVLKLIKDK